MRLLLFLLFLLNQSLFRIIVKYINLTTEGSKKIKELTIMENGKGPTLNLKQ